LKSLFSIKKDILRVIFVFSKSIRGRALAEEKAVKESGQKVKVKIKVPIQPFGLFTFKEFSLPGKKLQGSRDDKFMFFLSQRLQ